jgi:hypothetical protein
MKDERTLVLTSTELSLSLNLMLSQPFLTLLIAFDITTKKSLMLLDAKLLMVILKRNLNIESSEMERFCRTIYSYTV